MYFEPNVQEEQKECKYCKEMVRKDCKVCPHCGKQLKLNWTDIVIGIIIFLILCGLTPRIAVWVIR